MSSSMSGSLSSASGHTQSDSSLCCCVLLSDGAFMIEHRLVCFYLWFQRPFLAVHAEGLQIPSERLRVALADVGVDTETCLHGYYRELSTADAEVVKYCEQHCPRMSSHEGGDCDAKPSGGVTDGAGAICPDMTPRWRDGECLHMLSPDVLYGSAVFRTVELTPTS
ncbi:hypothetical protein HPB50_019432 [Hyalomma asiaticum]|uniref:Uncharacterized protein n=1 Tax=Hyalomma asiaticum TaxID=266040 RepID=A0ACB7RQ03_HYAAI|nr:hypothetical protein HPB50_019432 [Hyalomma asiaticum]